MRHAAPRHTPSNPLSRGAQLALGALAYTIAGLSTCLITLGASITIWGLWQWLGVK